MNTAAARRHAILYDGDCPFCQRQIQRLRWLDWLNCFEPIPLADPRAARIAPHIPRSELLEAMHCITRDGRILKGARSVRFIALRLPLIAVPALFLWLPGAIWIADRIYGWVSRNRYRLSRKLGCEGACGLTPPPRNP